MPLPVRRMSHSASRSAPGRPGSAPTPATRVAIEFWDALPASQRPSQGQGSHTTPILYEASHITHCRVTAKLRSVTHRVTHRVGTYMYVTLQSSQGSHIHPVHLLAQNNVGTLNVALLSSKGVVNCNCDCAFEWWLLRLFRKRPHLGLPTCPRVQRARNCDWSVPSKAVA